MYFNNFSSHTFDVYFKNPKNNGIFNIFNDFVIIFYLKISYLTSDLAEIIAISLKSI